MQSPGWGGPARGRRGACWRGPHIADFSRSPPFCAPPAAWAFITGYKFTEIANQTSAFLQGPETERDCEQDLVTKLHKAQHTKVRILNYTKDGLPFYNILECFPLRNPEGELTHYCGVIRAEPAGPDVARRLTPPLLAPPPPPELYPQAAAFEPRVDDRASAAAAGISRRATREAPRNSRPKRQRGQQTRLADALNNTMDAVVMTEPTYPYNITHVNTPWCEMCGYTQEDVEGLPNSILHGPETDQSILDDLMSSVARGEPTSASLINYKKGGTKFLNQVTVTPLFNEDDEIEQFMAMLHEVDGGV